VKYGFNPLIRRNLIHGSFKYMVVSEIQNCLNGQVELLVEGVYEYYKWMKRTNTSYSKDNLNL
jgi:hypothetical protein